jgi:hypothetical protein
MATTACKPDAGDPAATCAQWQALALEHPQSMHDVQDVQGHAAGGLDAAQRADSPNAAEQRPAQPRSRWHAGRRAATADNAAVPCAPHLLVASSCRWVLHLLPVKLEPGMTCDPAVHSRLQLRLAVHLLPSNFQMTAFWVMCGVNHPARILLQFAVPIRHVQTSCILALLVHAKHLTAMHHFCKTVMIFAKGA